MCCPCCTNTLDLGCFEPCGLTFTAGVVGVGEGGVWSIKLDFLRRFVGFSETLADGDPIAFDLEGINEMFTYTAQIFKPDGTIFTYTDGDGNTFDCFKFSTKKGGSAAITL